MTALMTPKNTMTNNPITVPVFRNNDNLKAPGASIEWTPELLEEYIKCADDPVYFVETYVKIVHPDHGFIPFKPFDFQKEIIQSFHDYRRTAVVTSRQAGKTTVAAGILLHYAIFNSHKRVAILANKMASAVEVMSRIQMAFEGLPKWLQQGVLTWNKGSMELENRSSIFAAATSSSAIRGKTVNALYIDECAFVENWEEFSASVLPTISSGKTTKILYTSTPKGLNHYYKICEGAEDGSNGYNLIRAPWYRVPGRDEEWKQNVIHDLDGDMQKFRQEYECEFLGSSGTLIDGERLKALVIKNPLYKKSGLSVYEKPVKGKSYVCVADVGEGKGLDYSTFSIFDTSAMPYKQVVAFRDNMLTPIEYAEILARVGGQYNDAMMLVENNSVGGQVTNMLAYDFEYENMVYTANKGRNGKQISSAGGELGIRTSKTVKAQGCNNLKLMIEGDQLIVHDYHTINELSTFARKGRSYEAEPGRHDDMVMTLVLFSWLSAQQYFSELTDIDTMAALRERSHEQIMADLAPVGFLDDDEFNGDDGFW